MCVPSCVHFYAHPHLYSTPISKIPSRAPQIASLRPTQNRLAETVFPAGKDLGLRAWDVENAAKRKSCMFDDKDCLRLD